MGRLSVVSNTNEIFPFTPLHHQQQPKITETRQDESMNSCCTCKILPAPSVCHSTNWDLSEQAAFFAICPALVSLFPMLPMKEAEPGVVYCCCCCAFRDNVIDDTVITGGCFPVTAELPMFLFFAPLSVSSRDCCAWKSPEISRFWDTQTSLERRGRNGIWKWCETD